VKAFLLALRFLLELGALASLAWWGAGISLVVAVAAPLAFAVLWGLFMSPTARIELPVEARRVVEAALWVAAAAALGAVWTPLAVAIFAVVAIADAYAVGR
jgi:hypothetical protein